MDISGKKLYRSRTDRMIAGVCGGLAKYFFIDPVIIRAGFVLLGLLNGIGVLLYIVLAIITPEEGETEGTVSGSDAMPNTGTFGNTGSNTGTGYSTSSQSPFENAAQKQQRQLLLLLVVVIAAFVAIPLFMMMGMFFFARFIF